MTDEDYQDLIDLANRHIENRIDPDERARLEKIIAENPDARKVFADFSHDHAALHWEHVSQSENVTQLVNQSSTKSRANLFSWCAGIAALITFSALIGIFISDSTQSSPETFATMETTRAARWESGDLPTSAGARLTTGTLTLAEGLATILFDSGAEVILEAPAQFRLIDRMNCELTSGTAVADIPESAIGFEIGTPSANVVDYGTRFAVNVDASSGATQTQVFEGLVEVEHPKTGEIVQLRTGETNSVEGDSLGEATAAPEELEWVHAAPPVSRGPEWLALPTTRDAYIYSSDIKIHHSNELLLLKNSSDQSGPHRKIYLGFDLSAIPLSKVSDAELTLQFSPTGWGLASHVADAHFTVYGIDGRANDQWNEGELHWDTAPVNDRDSGDAIAPGAGEVVGTFLVEQGIQRGEFHISGEPLARFLKKQTDGFATFIIVRNTKEIGGAGLVHGIASRRHPTLPAPTLAIRLEE